AGAQLRTDALCGRHHPHQPRPSVLRRPRAPRRLHPRGLPPAKVQAHRELGAGSASPLREHAPLHCVQFARWRPRSVQFVRFAQHLVVLGALIGSPRGPVAYAQPAAACNLPYYQPVAAGASRTYATPTTVSGTLTFTIEGGQGGSFDEVLSYVPAVTASGGGVQVVSTQEATSYQCQGGGLYQLRHDASSEYSDGSSALVSFFDFAGPHLPPGLAPGMTW